MLTFLRILGFHSEQNNSSGLANQRTPKPEAEAETEAESSTTQTRGHCIATMSRSEPSAVKSSGKKGKKFSTPSSMLSILNQVQQVEDGRINKKMERQKNIKRLVQEKERRSAEKKMKKSSRFEEIKNQLRQGYRLGGPAEKEKPSRKQRSAQTAKNKGKLDRTLSSINREWSSAIGDGESSESAASQSSSISKSKKVVTFSV
ncbi:hypothetical protein GGI07_005291 [Coemansia sp. Benny D115]|nr:hypothetical protein GGI07_005291 [Coemansia sp. Benny D115]